MSDKERYEFIQEAVLGEGKGLSGYLRTQITTKEIMIAFYLICQKTKNKSAAFITAQKAIKEKYIHPYFWGAFVMMGE